MGKHKKVRVSITGKNGLVIGSVIVGQKGIECYACDGQTLLTQEQLHEELTHNEIESIQSNTIDSLSDGLYEFTVSQSISEEEDERGKVRVLVEDEKIVYLEYRSSYRAFHSVNLSKEESKAMVDWLNMGKVRYTYMSKVHTDLVNGKTFLGFLGYLHDQ